MSNIIACNADGSAKPAAEQPQQKQQPLEMRPFSDGNFIKYVDRPVPKGVISTQKILFNSQKQSICITPNAEVAEFLCHCVNTFCLAAHKVQMDKQRAVEQATADADAFAAPVADEPQPESTADLPQL